MKYLILGFIVSMVFVGKKIYDVSNAVNSEFDNFFQRSGNRHNINPNYIKALGLNESWLGKYTNTVTVQGRTTGGIMHIELPTARDYVSHITPEQLTQPENEIEIATRHFKWLLSEFDQDLELAVRAYNGGIGRVRQYLKNEAPDHWIKNTTDYWERYQRNMKKLGEVV